MDKNSMLYWWPKVKELQAEIPMPKTIIINAGYAILAKCLDGEPLPIILKDRLWEAAGQLGYPVFMRTDQASGKHEWQNTCFVRDEISLVQNLYNLIEWNECAGFLGLPYEAIVLRKYIPLEAPFKAFYGEMPVARERRYFVRDGQIICHHPYWPEDAIRFPRGQEPAGWRDLLRELNTEPEDEVALLSGYAAIIGRRLPGYWSVDFAKGQDGVWYFIDMAEGHRSWHPPCQFGENND